jgi:RNA polymerase sigma-70 factor (ECF subfamily)
MAGLSQAVPMPAEPDRLSLFQRDRPRDARAGADDPEATITLVARARDGDTAALEVLCARFIPRMKRWAHGRLPAHTRSIVDTHDLVQDTLVHVVRRLDSFVPRHEGAFQGYVRQALQNRIIDLVRRTQGRSFKAVDTDIPATEPSPLELAVGSELLHRYEAALQRLAPEDREAIVARVEMGLGWREIAEQLQKNSPESAQMTVRRALVRLAREMASDRI